MSNESAVGSEARKLQDEFWRTRLAAKSAYKAWKLKPEDAKVMKTYSDAWAAHQTANMAQFFNECEES